MGSPLAPQVTRQYSLGPVKPVTEAAAYILGPMFGIKTIYGWRQSDPFPDHPSGHALDFMTPSKSAGDALSSFAQANYAALGVKYIIWNRNYWSPSTGWEPYTETSNPHTDHVHITFLDSTSGGVVNPAGGGNATPISTSTSTQASETCAWNLAAPSVGTPTKAFGVIPVPSLTLGGQSICILSKQQVRVMLGAGFLVTSMAIGLVGVVLLMVYGLKNTKAGNALISAVPGGDIVKRFI